MKLNLGCGTQHMEGWVNIDYWGISTCIGIFDFSAICVSGDIEVFFLEVTNERLSNQDILIQVAS